MTIRSQGSVDPCRLRQLSPWLRVSLFTQCNGRDTIPISALSPSLACNPGEGMKEALQYTATLYWRLFVVRE